MNASGNGNSYSPVGTLFRRDLQFQLIENIADLLPVVVLVYDKVTRTFRLVNKKGLEVLGYNPVHEKWNEQDWEAMITSGEKGKEKSVADRSEIRTSGITVKTRNRNSLHGELTCVPLLSPDKDNDLVLLILNNLKEEVDSGNVEVQGMDIEKAMKSGTWTYLPDTGEMHWSAGMYAIFGYPEQINNKTHLNFFHSHLKDADRQQWHQSISNPGNFGEELELDVLTGEGTKRVSIQSRPVYDNNGHLNHFKGIACDITRYYNLYKELLTGKHLSAANEYFLNTGSWEVDLESGKVTWSDGMYKIFGYENGYRKEQEINSQLLYKHLLSEREVGRARSEWELFLQGNEEYIREMQIMTKEGRPRRIESCGRIIRDAGGKAVKVIGATRDITMLREYESKLERKVQELAQINKDLEEFAYVASHDLQEPLRKITTFSERISTKFSESLGSEGKMYLDRMSAAAENMRMLIENLLEFSRTTRTNTQFEKCNLNSIVKDTLKELELKLEETAAIVKVGDLPSPEASAPLIKQLFSNLISNAIKFRKPGECPVIQIYSRETSEFEKKKYGLNPKQKYFHIEVADEGIGFEKEYAEKIFKIFQRLHGKSEYPGSGIGLAICKKIIDFHNGTIYANSQEGKGSQFIFILPENQYK